MDTPADDDVEWAAILVHAQDLLDDLVGDEEVRLVDDGDRVLQFVVGPAAGDGLHMAPDALVVEGEDLLLALGDRRAHDQPVAVEDLDQVGEHQFALRVVGVDLLDIGAQRCLLEGEDARIDLARLQQFALGEGIGAAVVNGPVGLAGI